MDALHYDGGYHFSSNQNLKIVGDFVYYFTDSDMDSGKGRKYRIGSGAPAVEEGLYYERDNWLIASTSPNGRYIAAANRVGSRMKSLPWPQKTSFWPSATETAPSPASPSTTERPENGMSCSSGRSTPAADPSARSSGPTTAPKSTSTTQAPSPASGNTTSRNGRLPGSFRSTTPCTPFFIPVQGQGLHSVWSMEKREIR
uniref:Uncharacterized protein n=1 Tax=Candidatus Kentrum sp. DK TaxID=2126562 RepID=A0A450RVW3_9GAMM|nr:MAG: hypothetical protein BECKDK2373B_GA0170837_10055 [Candidatus Kentron sp. DK]